VGTKQTKFDENEPKMVFQVKYVPPDDAMVVFQVSKFSEVFIGFYTFLNQWAVGKDGYNNAAAAKKEGDLERECNFVRVVTRKAIQLLESTKNDSISKYHELQTRFVE
jgi:hypothetical protein